MLIRKRNLERVFLFGGGGVIRLSSVVQVSKDLVLIRCRTLVLVNNS